MKSNTLKNTMKAPEPIATLIFTKKLMEPLSKTLNMTIVIDQFKGPRVKAKFLLLLSPLPYPLVLVSPSSEKHSIRKSK
jgi:hypothetical protein